jgi:hypothetical protein
MRALAVEPLPGERATHDPAAVWHLASVGHNGGPPLDEHVPAWGVNGVRSYFTWRAARQKAFSGSRDAVLRRLRRAKACGLTYEQYTSYLLDTGRHLQPEDVDLIARIKASGPAE